MNRQLMEVCTIYPLIILFKSYYRLHILYVLNLPFKGKVTTIQLRHLSIIVAAFTHVKRSINV
jgi:hypothetical protein